MDTQLQIAFLENFCLYATRTEFQLTLRHSGKQANNAHNALHFKAIYSRFSWETETRGTEIC